MRTRSIVWATPVMHTTLSGHTEALERVYVRHPGKTAKLIGRIWPAKLGFDAGRYDEGGCLAEVKGFDLWIDAMDYIALDHRPPVDQ